MPLAIGKLQGSAIILDRDGVINQESDAYIKSPEEWHPIPRALEAIARLCQHGIQVHVATNQSGVARGFYDESMLQAIHERMCQSVAALGGLITSVAYCPHLPSFDCNCRKPKPGLLHQIRDNYGIILEQTPFIGDSLRDIQAAQAANCIPILVRSGHGTREIAKNQSFLTNIDTFDDLWDAVAYLL